jgi:hypothetical protein
MIEPDVHHRLVVRQQLPGQPDRGVDMCCQA